MAITTDIPVNALDMAQDPQDAGSKMGARLQAAAKRPNASESSQRKRMKLMLEEEEDDSRGAFDVDRFCLLNGVPPDLPSLSQLPAVIDTSHLNLPSARVPTRLEGRTFDGKAVSFRRRATPSRSASTVRAHPQVLLSQPIYKMKQDILAMQQEQQAKQQKANAQREQALPRTNPSNQAQQSGQMWTDKYRPTQYMDLLGDDRVNRAVMSWLKEWDACVFKTAAAQNQRKKALAEKRKKAREDQLAQGNANEQAPSDDPWGRPLEKVLLLAGPPGLGKTTLAHIVAKQAGYQVHEVNASDDRNARVVSERIRDAVESRSLTMGGGMSVNRPTCVVIDEIDGAAGSGDTGFVRSLVKLIVDGSKIPKKGRASRKDQKPLIRPIICICNDLYATVLRPLRPLARLIRFQPPAPNLLISRIKWICDAEGMSADGKSLATLVSVTDGDLRTCLNTLQIIQTNNVRVDEHTVKSTALGLKDSGTSPSTVWDHLFRIAYNRKGKNSGDNRYVDRLVKDLSTCGEYEKLSQGCFEYYPRAKLPTEGWGAIQKSLDWLLFYDSLDACLKSERNFELLPYMPYSFVAWHPLFANVANKSPEWPKIDYEAFLNRQAYQEIADTFHRGLPATLRCSFNATQSRVELAPILMRILSPDIKLLGGHAAKDHERQAIDKLVNLLTHLKMSFIPDRNEEGQLTLKLEPAIDVFIHYDGKRATDVPPSRYAVRQLVLEQLKHSALSGDPPLAASTADELLSAYKNVAAETSSVAAGAVDFFGRLKPKAEDKPALGGPVKTVSKPAVRFVYKFHEGFSNAVKLPIKIADLFRQE